MEEVQIWSLDGNDANQLPTTGHLESESGLEDILVNNPGLLLEDLTLVGRQTPTEGGPLDLLGVDGYGKLVVFELKRGTLARDAVAQIIDYASDLDAMDLADLASLISNDSGSGGIEKIEDFEEWYDSQPFEVEGLDALLPPCLFLVGLGTNSRTERMVKFLADNSGMDISLLTFHGFEYDGKILLAKQVEVDGETTPPDSSQRRTRRYVSRAERQRQLDARIRGYGVQVLFADSMDLFRENWRSPGERPGAYGMSVRLRDRTESGRLSWRAYARVDPDSDGQIRIVFYPRAIDLCSDEFRPAIEQIQLQTYPAGREGQALETPDTEIQFFITADDWETHKETLTTLTQAVYKAWEAGGSVE